MKKYEPDIICISEANITSKYNFNINNFPGYNLILNAQNNKIKTSRNCILIRDRIKYIRRGDSESDITCDIWVEITIGNKHPLLCGSYRQWSLLKAMGINDSKNIKLKEARYKITLEG